MNIGEKLPEYLGRDLSGKDVKLSDFTGMKLLLYVLPENPTKGCISDVEGLNHSYGRIAAAGNAVVGVSTKGADGLGPFSEEGAIKFPVIADTDRRLVNELGVYGEKHFYDHTETGTFHTVIRTDRDGVITDIRHYDREVIEAQVKADAIIHQYRQTLAARHREATEKEEHMLQYMHDWPFCLRQSWRIVGGRKMFSPNRCRTCHQQFWEIDAGSVYLVCPTCGKISRSSTYREHYSVSRYHDLGDN